MKSAAMDRVLLFNEFDAKSVHFSTNVDKNKKGGNVVYLGMGPEGKQRVFIQTPPLPLPFGVSPYVDASGTTQSYSIDCSFRTAGTDPKVKEFMDRILEFDDVLLNLGVERSKEFFGKSYSKEMVSEFYRKLVKNSNPEYPPVLKVKVPLVGGEPVAQFFDEYRNPVPIDYMTKGTVLRMIVEVSSIWFVNKTYGVTLKLVQAQAVARPNRMDGFSFQDDGENVETNEDTEI